MSVVSAVKSAVWRLHGGSVAATVARYCKGQGLEIGAGKSPFCDPRRTKFLDRFTDNKDGTPAPDYVADFNEVPTPDEVFDFVFSSHVLEHAPNTIETLGEWLRVLRPGGTLVLALPHAERTLDRFRARTTLEHHIEDFARQSGEPDHSHDEEVKAGWSKLPDIEAQTAQYEREWGAPIWDFDFRLANGVMHYHVWTQNDVVRLLQHLGLEILEVVEQARDRADTFIVAARKPYGSHS